MILVAENLTVTNRLVHRAVAERDPEPIRDVARTAGAAGARYLDVNLGSGKMGGGEAVTFVLEVLKESWDGGILVDTVRADVMEAAARVWEGALVLNGYSGDEGRDAVLDVAAKHDLDVVVFVMERGIPKGLDARLALATDLVGRCANRGIGTEKIWIDPVVAPVGWIEGQEFNADLVEMLRRLPEVLGEPVQSIVGLSNLTTGAAAPQGIPWLQEVFLALLAGAGLTHAMVDVRNQGVLRVARALDVFQGGRVFAAEEFA